MTGRGNELRGGRDPLLPNAVIVARREFRERVRSRLFVVSTVLLALLAIGIACLPLAIRVAEKGSVTRIAIASTDPELLDSGGSFIQALFNTGGSGGGAYRIERIGVPPVAVAEVYAGALDGAIVAQRGPTGAMAFQIVTGESLSLERTNLLQIGLLGLAVVDWSTKQGRGAGFELPTIDVLAAGPTGGGAAPITDLEFANRRLVGMVLGFLIFFTIVIYGMWVAAGVVAEKSSRVMELLVSAASSAQLVVGKIAGIGLAGLTQIVLVGLPSVLALVLQDRLATFVLGPGSGFAPSLTGLNAPLLISFIAYFALGFVLYAAIYAGAGSLVSKPEDLQVIALPLAILAIAGYFMALLALTGGTGGFIRIASYIPFWSPFVMLTRLTVGRVAAWELALSIGLLAITAPIVVALAIRVYRAGVLLYGQRPSWRMFFRAIRTPA